MINADERIAELLQEMVSLLSVRKPVDRFRTIEEVAELLAIPEKTLRSKVTAREVPFTRIGKHVRFSPDDLVEIVARGRVKSAPANAARAVDMRPSGRRRRA